MRQIFLFPFARAGRKLSRKDQTPARLGLFPRPSRSEKSPGHSPNDPEQTLSPPGPRAPAWWSVTRASDRRLPVKKGKAVRVLAQCFRYACATRTRTCSPSSQRASRTRPPLAAGPFRPAAYDCDPGRCAARGTPSFPGRPQRAGPPCLLTFTGANY